MKLSADKKHPWYSPDCHNYEVYFNGEKQKNCVHVNDETGEIWILATEDINGRPHLVIEGDSFKINHFTGNVEIKPILGYSPNEEKVDL